MVEAINNNISFFQNIRLELQKRHQIFEESFSRPITLASSTRYIPVTRHAISRSTSISFQPNIQPVQQVKQTKRHKKTDDSTDHNVKPMTSQTIWNSINRFFGVSPTAESFQQYLNPIEEKIAVTPLGQHYSIAYNQKLRQRFKNDNVRIKVPDYVDIPSKKIGDFNVVSSHRLLAALIPVVHDDSEASLETMADHAPDEEHSKVQPTNDFKLDNSNENLYPTNVFGTSYYSKLSFEAKLSLEVISLDLKPSSDQPEEIDSEVMNDLVNLKSEYTKIIEKTNKSRSTIITNLKAIQEKLAIKHEKYKIWAQMIEKAEKENKTKSGRPKNRDKLT